MTLIREAIAEKNRFADSVMHLMLRIIRKVPEVEEIEFLLPGNVRVVVVVPRIK